MTLTDYNPKLLNFLYELTKLDSFMSINEIAKKISLEGGKIVTPKTVKNWFDYLHEPISYQGMTFDRKVSYFPSIIRESLGLQFVALIFENPKKDLLNFFPFQEYVSWLFDAKLAKHVLFVVYSVPKNFIKDFFEVIESLKKDGFMSHYRSYVLNSPVRIFSPFHKVVDINGVFRFEKNDVSELERQIQKYYPLISNPPQVEMIRAIRKNPFIIPVLFEYNYEHWSSVTVWNSIKKKLGDNVWGYIRKSRKRSDGIGIKNVQDVIRQIGNLGLFNQMRVVYLPFQMIHNFFIYAVIDFDSAASKDFLLELSKNCLITTAYRSGNNLFLILLVNKESFQKVLDVFERVNLQELLFLRYDRSVALTFSRSHTKIDYPSIFNPRTSKWHYMDSH